jgi:hydrogenase-4 component E
MNIFLVGIAVSTLIIMIAGRMTALINGFSLQSFFLFLLTASLALGSANPELYAIAALVLTLKVLLIPFLLRRIVKKINVAENLGLLVNPVLSLAASLLLAYLSYVFATRFLAIEGTTITASFSVAMFVIMTGLFIMVFRMKALAQVIGLLAIENGLFLAAVSLSGDMTFFVEIAIFFDILIFVLIIGVFVYRINDLFTHIDVDKLTKLKG